PRYLHDVLTIVPPRERPMALVQDRPGRGWTDSRRGSADCRNDSSTAATISPNNRNANPAKPLPRKEDGLETRGRNHHKTRSKDQDNGTIVPQSVSSESPNQTPRNTE